MAETVLIAGYYGRRNAGDEAILGGMLAELRGAREGLRFRVVSWDPEWTRALHGVDAIPWADIPGLIDAIREATLVVVGGGGLFHDYWGVDRAALLTARQAGIAQYASPIFLARLLGKPCMLYAVGVGPLRAQEARELTREVFEAADAVTVRDLDSRRLVHELGFSGPPIEVVPDPAFHLPEIPLEAHVAELLAKLPRPILGVALRDWSFGVKPEEWQAEASAAIDDHLAERGGTALFVPLQDGQTQAEDDVRLSREVMRLMRRSESAALIHDGLNPLQRLSALEACDAVLGMRLHAVVAAIRRGIPVVGLAYDAKVAALMNAEGLGEVCLQSDGWERDRIGTALRAAAEASRIPGAHEGKEPRAARSAEIAARLIARGLEATPARQSVIQTLALEKVREVERLTKWMAAQGETIAQLEERVTEQSRERDELIQQLSSLRGTVGVRILASYWRWAKMALPPGSRRRRLAASIRRMVFGSHVLGLPPWGFGANGGREFQSPGLSDLRTFLRRPRNERPRLVALILAPTPLDLDEGQRSTHLAYELARSNEPVIFAYWRWRPDHRPQSELEKGIVQIPLDELLADPAPVLDIFPSSRRLLLIEFPHPRFFGLVAAARGRGWICVYDMVDDWGEFHRVGQAPWYQRDFEVHLVSTADAVVAVGPGLARKAHDLAGRDPEIIPNGVDRDVSRIMQPRPIERGKLTLGYFGHLTRAWFDWDLISEVARARQDWRIHLIGYGDEPPKHLPHNVILHGKVPRSELASYAANWDVALIPFRRSSLAASANPVKLYEYLAMGLPVLVTGVVPPPGTERLVAKAEGVDSFIAESMRLAGQREDQARLRKELAAGCSWEKRLDHLLGLLAARGQRIALQDALFESEG